MKPSILLFSAVFGLLLLVLFTTGCPPDDTLVSDCERRIPLLEYSATSCQTQSIDLPYDPAGPEAQDSLDLPADCAANGIAPARVFRLPSNRSGTLTLQQYLAEPIRTQVEVFSGSCDSTLTLVACEKMEGLVSEWSLGVSGQYPLFIRVTPLEVTGDKTKPDKPLRVISFVAYDGKASSRGCPDQNGPPRRVLVAVAGTQVALIDVANELGLVVSETCACAAPFQLAALDLPPNVDLDEIGGKLTTKTNTQIDTIHYNLEPIIRFEAEEKYDSLLKVYSQFIGPLGGYIEAHNQSGGSIVRVVVIDSGVDTTGHPIIHNLAWDLNQPGDACFGDFSDLGYDFAGNNPHPNDQVGHGTGVAGVVISRWPADLRLQLAHLKFYATEGRLFDGLCALHAAARARADVINLSWGISESELPGPMYQALRHAEQAGAIVVASAGNDKFNIDTMPQWPAAATSFRQLVTTGAYLIDGTLNPTLADFSNYSKNRVHVAGPFALETLKANGGTAFKAGTSISAPFVAARLAEFRANMRGAPAPDVVQTFLLAQPVSPQLPDSIRDGRFVPF